MALVCLHQKVVTSFSGVPAGIYESHTGHFTISGFVRQIESGGSICNKLGRRTRKTGPTRTLTSTKILK